MASAPTGQPAIREAVASFPDREHFSRAVSALKGAGFEHSDLSVLASHEALNAAEAALAPEHAALPAGLGDETGYIGPLTLAGLVLFSGGPIAAGLAALVGAGLGGVALKEIIDRYTGPNHADDFAAALAAGAALLWVRCENAERERRALRLLEEAGGRHVHIYTRTPHPDATGQR